MADSRQAGQRGGIGSRLGAFFGVRPRAAPTSTLGEPGVAIYAGYPDTGELSRELATVEQRYKIYGNILANTAIVAAGTRYFLNLVAGAGWSFSPAEGDTSGEWVERAEQILTEDPQTPWPRIVRRAAMYRMYGFSVQEWTMRRHEEGHLTFHDIAPRAQKTIERWDVDEYGNVLGVLQRSPQTSIETYLPRAKVLYIVDDSLNDSPEGLGLFRHIVDSAKRLERYQVLEGYGFETDLRGVPVGYAPFAELSQMVQKQQITVEDRKRLEKPIRDFIKNHIRNPMTGMVLDSAVYAGAGEQQTPINVKQWQIDLLSGESQGFEPIAASIERLNREIARVLGVEQLLLGSGSAGSFALANSKTSEFHQIVDSVLGEIRAAVQSDLIKRAWSLNGWPEDMMPEAQTEVVRHRDVVEVAQVLRDMATAGAPLAPDDEAINDVRALAGISPVDLGAERERAEADAAMRSAELEAMRNAPQPDDPEDDLDEPDA